MRRKHGHESVDITPDAYAALTRYHWPGNARELRNAIEVAMLCADGAIDVERSVEEGVRALMRPAITASATGPPGSSRALISAGSAFLP